tara:strand:- start:1261 stop:1695 length:435 start_codon:yes stop_codon:yes gene_type:complete
MKLFDLCDDILTTIINEIYIIRYDKMKQEFNDEWLDRRPHHKLYCSGRRIHEGRAFLKKDLKNVQLINFHQQCFIHNLLLYPYIEYSYDPIYEPRIYGLRVRLNESRIQTKIIELCENNGWSDYKDHTNETIIAYLITKEEKIV